jgi:hypothetical protein
MCHQSHTADSTILDRLPCIHNHAISFPALPDPIVARHYPPNMFIGDSHGGKGESLAVGGDGGLKELRWGDMSILGKIKWKGS